MKRLTLLCLCISLSACLSSPKRETPSSAPPVSSTNTQTTNSAEQHNALVCKQTRQHDERDYVSGGLYAPGVADAPPIGELDVSQLQEPLPRVEPKSKYGNRSPYSVQGKNYTVLDSAQNYDEQGVASWYGTKFHGRATSSQEIYDMCQFSAAHKSLPIPSYARVTRLDTGKSVIVRINDRGPFHEGRLIDLSFAAATKLGINKTGLARVRVEAIEADQGNNSATKLIYKNPEAFSGKQYLQVGAFSSQGNAEALVQQLLEWKIEPSFVLLSQINGNTLWRVRIGPFDETESEQILQKLNEKQLNAQRVRAD